MVINSDKMITKNREPKGVQSQTQTASLTFIKVPLVLSRDAISCGTEVPKLSNHTLTSKKRKHWTVSISSSFSYKTS